MKTQYTNYTPIPSQVPRQLAIEILQSHSEIITLNPLVLDHHPIKAPRDCPNDEYYSTWYEIHQRIQFVPGLKKMGSGKVTFRGCFHDMPWGVQTHMYIPMGVDLRNKWQIRGTQPGEAPEPRELGSGAPSSGLYLREEVEITCNPLAISFVKKETKAASLIMVERMLKKAELLDAGVLQGMFENGKLKTFNPRDRTSVVPASPTPASPGHWRQSSVPDARMSMLSASSQGANRENPNQLGQIPHPEGSGGMVVEMPGDFLYPSQATHQNQNPSDRYSVQSGSDRSGEQHDQRYSYMSSSDRNSVRSGPTSYSHTNSPNPDTKNFTAELPGSGHMDAEASKSRLTPQESQQTLRNPSPNPSVYNQQAYNPQNYARFAANGY